MAKVVKFEFPFGVQFNEFFCPGCGAALMDKNQFAEKPCPHLAFAFLGDVGEFTYVSPRLRKAAESAEGSESAVKALGAKLDKDTGAVFELTTGGMACGPVWSTVVLGIELCEGEKKAARRGREDKKKKAAAGKRSAGGAGTKRK